MQRSDRNDSGATAIRLLVELGRIGFVGPIKANALMELVGWARDYTVETVVEWIKKDSGWVLMPTARWWAWDGEWKCWPRK